MWASTRPGRPIWFNVLLGAGFGAAGVQAVFGDPIAGNEDLPPDRSDVD